MLRRCLKCVLIVLGVVLVGAAVLPVFSVLPISDWWRTGLVAAKFVMLPLGAFSLAGAAALSARVHRR